MITSLILSIQFLIGIGRRLRSDPYYRTLGVLTLIILVIGTLVVWLAGGWPFADSLLYAVSTMSMNTPYSGPLVAAANTGLKFFHMGYTFLSVGVFIIFALETGKTMITTYEEFMKKMADRKAKKAAAKAAAAGQKGL